MLDYGTVCMHRHTVCVTYHTSIAIPYRMYVCTVLLTAPFHQVPSHTVHTYIPTYAYHSCGRMHMYLYICISYDTYVRYVCPLECHMYIHTETFSTVSVMQENEDFLSPTTEMLLTRGTQPGSRPGHTTASGQRGARSL